MTQAWEDPDASGADRAFIFALDFVRHAALTVGSSPPGTPRVRWLSRIESSALNSFSSVIVIWEFSTGTCVACPTMALRIQKKADVPSTGSSVKEDDLEVADGVEPPCTALQTVA